MDIKQTAEAIRAIIDSGDWVLMIIVLIIALGFTAVTAIKHMKSIIESLDFMRRVDLNRLKDIVQDEKLNSDLHALADNEIQQMYFWHITGITASKPMRDKLIEINQKSGYCLKLSDYRHAFEYLRLEDGKIVVKRSRTDKILHNIGWYAGLTVLVMTGILMPLILLLMLLGAQADLWKSIITLIVLGFAAFLILIANRSWFAANRVQKVLNTFQE